MELHHTDRNTSALKHLGNEAGIEGTMILKLFSTCCLFPDSTDPCATSTTFPTNDLVLEIVMEDDAGNSSNTITSSAIVLLCN